MNYFVALSSAQDTAEQIEFFFSKANLIALFNKLCNWSVSLAGKIIMALIVWQIGKRLIIWLVKIIVKALGKSDLDVGVARFIGSITKFAGYAILILIVVGILGIPTASLITVFGSAALAVGMSLQGSLSNFAGGILLLIFKPFKIGDYIISGSCEGTVVSIELLYTKLHTIDNKIIMMPNGTLSNSNIINVGAEEVRRYPDWRGISDGFIQGKGAADGMLKPQGRNHQRQRCPRYCKESGRELYYTRNQSVGCQ